MVDLITWWYRRGWSSIWDRFNKIANDTLDFFSIADSLKNLFKPFRQTLTADSLGRQSFGQKLGDAFVSRGVGFVMRLMLIFLGVLSLAVEMLIFFVLVVLWPFIPVAPAIMILFGLINFGF